MTALAKRKPIIEAGSRPTALPGYRRSHSLSYPGQEVCNDWDMIEAWRPLMLRDNKHQYSMRWKRRLLRPIISIDDIM